MSGNNELGSLVVRIGADTTGFTQGLGQVSQQMRLLQSRLASSISNVNGTENSFARLREVSVSLSQQYNVQRQRLEVLNQAYSHLVTTQGANSRSAQDMEIRINRETASLNDLERRLRETNEQLRLQSSRWYLASQSMANAATRMKVAGEKIASAGRTMSMYVTAPIVAAGIASVKLATDMNETMNKVDVVFDKSASRVKAWGDTTLKSIGMAKTTSLDMASLFGDMATSMGMSSDKAANMSMKLVELAGDLSSFKNISFEESKNALNAIFTGEAEPLKKLGVIMLDRTLQEYALSKGIKTKLAAMTEAEKVELRYNYVIEKTKNSSGDFKNTIDSTANQMRLFQESAKQLGTTFGEKILPILTPIIVKLNSLMEKFASLDSKTQMTIIKIAAFAAAIGPVLIVVGSLISAIGSIVGVFSAASGAIAAAGGAAAALTAIFTALTGPVGIAIGIISALTGAVLLYKDGADKAAAKQKLFNDALADMNRIKKEGIKETEIADITDKKKKLDAAINQYNNADKNISLYPNRSKKVDGGGAIELLSETDKKVDNFEKAKQEALNKLERMGYSLNTAKETSLIYGTELIKAKKKVDEKSTPPNGTSTTSSNAGDGTSAYDEALAEYEYKKHIGKLTYTQEIGTLNNIKRKYAETTEQKREMEMKLYDLKKEHTEKLKDAEQKTFDKQISDYEYKLKLGKVSYSQEVIMLNDILKKYAVTADQKKDIEVRLFNLKKTHEDELQSQKQKNLEKQQSLYDKQLSALDKIKNMFEKAKTDKADNEHIAYLQDRIKRTADPLEKAGLVQELDKFRKDMADKNSLSIFDSVRDKITTLKDNVGISAKELSAQAKESSKAMADVFNMLKKEGLSGISIKNQYTALPAGASSNASSSNNFYITIDAKNVKEFNDVVKIIKELPTKKKKK